MPFGFVYILSNPAMPGCVKIGYSTHVPDYRAAQLSEATGVPKRFRVEYWCLTEDAELVEKRVHERLATSRMSNDREFFEVRIDEAIAVVDQLSNQLPSRFERPRHFASDEDGNPTLECPFCKKKNFVRLCRFCGQSW